MHKKKKEKHTKKISASIQKKTNGIGHGPRVVRRVLHKDTVTSQKQTDATIHSGAAVGWENFFTGF
jgi:hypothetical protein